MRLWDSVRRFTGGRSGRGQASRIAPRSLRPFRHRSLQLDPLEERQLLSLSPADSYDVLVNTQYIEKVEMIAGQSVAVDNDGDFVAVWSQQDRYDYRYITGVDTVTGDYQYNYDSALEWNVYGRYFTDEVQRVTLSPAVNTSYSWMTLRYGGDMVTEKLTFSSQYQPVGYSNSISGLFSVSFNGVSSPTSNLFQFDENTDPETSAQQLERHLVKYIAPSLPPLIPGTPGNQLVDGQGNSLVHVVPLSPNEFQITYLANDSQVQSGQQQSLITAAPASGGTGISVAADCLSQPYLIRNIPVYKGNSKLTAQNIEEAFRRQSPYFSGYSGETVSVTWGYDANDCQYYDVTFVGESGKKDHPPLKVTSLTLPSGADVAGATKVRTIKEPSAVFRVNPDEPNDEFTIEPECYNQLQAAVAMDCDGEFVVTWTSTVSDTTSPGSGTDVFMRRFSVLGCDDTLTSATTDWVDYGMVTSEIRSLVSCDSRITQSLEFDVSSGTLGGQFRLKVPVASSGPAATSTTGNIAFSGNAPQMATDMKVALESLGFRDVHVVVTENDAVAGLYKFQIDYLATYGTSQGKAPYQVAVVQGINTDTQTLYPWINASIAPPEDLTEEYYTTRVNTDTTNPQGTPTVGMNDDGTFVIAWAGTGYAWPLGNNLDTGPGQEFSYFNSIYVQRFNRDGERQGTEVLLSQDTNEHSDPYVAVSKDGYVAIAWTMIETGWDAPPGPDPSTGQGQLVIADPQGNRFQFSLGSYIYQPTLAFDDDNNLLASWTEVVDPADGNPLHADQDRSPGGRSEGVRAAEYTMLGAGGVFAPSQNIAPFFVNNATLTSGQRAWVGRQWQSQALIDADGDITVTFDGYGAWSGAISETPTWAGEGNGILFTSRDASATGPRTILYSDEVVNAQRDGTDSTYAVLIGGDCKGGSFTLRVFNPGGIGGPAWVDVSVSVATVGDFFDAAGTAVNLEKALNGMPYLGPYPNDSNGPHSIFVTSYQQVSVSGEPSGFVWVFNVVFTGSLHNLDIDMRPWKGDALTSTIQNYKPSFDCQQIYRGAFGEQQECASSGMELDGDFTVVWLQHEQTNSQIVNGLGYITTSSNTNILYRRFDESSDTAGPNMTELRLTDGTTVVDDKQEILANIQQIIMTFDEELWLSGDDSAENTMNWVLKRDGVEIPGGIVKVEFGLNKAYDLGLTKLPSNKWEAVLTLDSNGDASDGEQSLSSGVYTVTALYPKDDDPTTPGDEGRPGLRDAMGNPLGLTGYVPEGEEQSLKLTMQEYTKDYGDAPYYSTGADAACHAIPSDIYLGSASPDADANGHPSTDARGDDITGVGNDEDGVQFAPDNVNSPGQYIAFDVTVNPGSVPGYLDAWIDWNGDGKWENYTYDYKDPNTGLWVTETVQEHLISMDLTPGSIPEVIPVQCQIPWNAPEQTIYARFRVSTDGAAIHSDTGYKGFAWDGEVEDYAIDIVATPKDFGDAEAPGTTGADAASHKYNQTTNLRLGSSVDFETDGQPNALAQGDDTAGKDDEDGVWETDGGASFGTHPLIKGEDNTTNISLSADGYLAVWIYLDNQWKDASSYIKSCDGAAWDPSSPLTAGEHTLTWDLNQAEVTPGNAFVRFRVNSTDDALGATGEALDGEVEDYAVTIVKGACTITGSVFKDIDANGEWQSGGVDLPWPSYTVGLYRDDLLWAQTTTNADGSYVFTELPRGQYKVQIEKPTDGGWIITCPSSGEGSIEVPLTIPTQIDDEGNDFGLYKKGRVSISDVTVVEGNDGKKQVQVTLHLTDSFGAPVEVHYRTTGDGTATPGDLNALGEFTGDADYAQVTDGVFQFTAQSEPEGIWNSQVLTQNTYNDYDYKASGNYIVWSAYDGTNWDVFLYDVTAEDPKKALIPLTNNLSGDHRNPVVSGNHVVWAGKLAGESDYEIYSYDIANQKTTVLTNNTVDDLEPALYGDPDTGIDTVVWTRSEASDKEIYLYHLPTDPATPVIDPSSFVKLTNNSYDDSGPVIYGSYVAWTTTIGSNKEIYLYDGTTTQNISLSSREDRNPVLSGEAIVWEAYDGTDYEIMGYVFDTGARVKVTNNSDNDVQAALSGTTVVWRGSDGTNAEIFAYDLALGQSGTAVNLSHNSYTNERPQIVGNRVVWHTYVGTQWDVYVLDLDSGLGPQNLSQNSQYDWYPQLTEDFVAWRSNINGNYEIVLAKQAEPEVTQTFTIDINGDPDGTELDEFFFIELTGSPQADLGDQTVAKVTILDDDGPMDLGDAPAPYPTLIADNGARHRFDGEYYLGYKEDIEADGLPSAGANADDILLSDDEDGLDLSKAQFVGGTVVSLPVTAHALSGGTGYLNVWLDLNADGDWDDTWTNADGSELSEHLFADLALTADVNGLIGETLQFFLPANIATATSYMRVRYSAEEGLGYTGKADTGEVEDYAISLKANPYLNGHALAVAGTTGNDTFEFALGAEVADVLGAIQGEAYRLTFNGATYYYPAALISSVVFQAGAGTADKVTIQGSSEDDSVWLWPSQLHFVHGGLDLWAYASENITVNSGGGTDTMRLYGSTGADKFVGTPTTASMSGTGYANTAQGFRYVYGISSGGSDTATLTGSAGDDTLQADPTNTTLSGSGYFTRVNAFRTVTVDGTSGGTDVAALTGSTAADTCVASPTQLTLNDTAKTTYTIVANGFEATRVDGLAGLDTGTLSDSKGKDLFVGKQGQSSLSGTGFNNALLGFEAVSATSTTGSGDSAYLYDSAGNDTFTASPTVATMKMATAVETVEVKNFGYVCAIASTGNNTAKLSDSTGNDTFTGGAGLSTMRTASATIQASQFQTVVATATTGTDTAEFYDSTGDDTFTAGGKTAADLLKATMSGTGYSCQGVGFDKYLAYATAGGADIANFYDSKGNDVFQAGGKTAADAGKATMTGTGFSYQGSGFAKYNAYATLGGTDTANFYDTAGDDTFQADAATTQAKAQAAMIASAFAYQGSGFDKYYAFATAGGRDVATLNGSTGADTFTGNSTTARLYSGSLFDYNLSSFEEVKSYGKGGTDTATMTDSAANDVLMAQGTWAQLSKADKAYSLLVDGFKTVKATSTNKGDTKSIAKALNFVLTATGKWT